MKSTLDFIPADIEEKYQKSDLDYKYCVAKFSEMAAVKRDKIPIPTMKLWFIEFIKLEWTKYKFDLQYNALLSSDILGYAIRIDHWINAVKPFVQKYDPYKPLPEQREKGGGGLEGLREFIDKLDKDIGSISGLPHNWKANLISDWRRGDRIKTELRSKK